MAAASLKLDIKSFDTTNLDKNKLKKISQSIENLLVQKNTRGMRTLQQALAAGYYFRAALLLLNAIQANANNCTIFIATGFPVGSTDETSYETDGPAGAISLYMALKQLGASPILLCPASLYQSIHLDYDAEPYPVNITLETQSDFARSLFDQYQPKVLIAIEAAGMAKDGDYYNMRGEVISDHAPGFDKLFIDAGIPTIAIGDGGNEIGMGNLHDLIQTELSIIPSNTGCDELLIADVSNWGGHGLALMLGACVEQDFLQDFDNQKSLSYFIQKGSLDGITGTSQCTEDGFPPNEGQQLVSQLKAACGFRM